MLVYLMELHILKFIHWHEPKLGIYFRKLQSEWLYHHYHGACGGSQVLQKLSLLLI